MLKELLIQYSTVKTTEVLAMAKKQLDNGKLEKLFYKFDYNKSGTIDYKEIKPMLKELGYSEAAIEACSLDMV